MKKLPLLVLLTALTAQAVGLRGISRTFTAAGLTENSPSGGPAPSATDPIGSTTVGAFRLIGGTGYRITLCAPAGQTLSGAGKVTMYYCPINNMNLCNGIWPRNPSLDEPVTVGATSCEASLAGAPCPCQTFLDHPSPGLPDGWIRPVLNGITVSGGTQPTVTIDFTSQT